MRFLRLIYLSTRHNLDTSGKKVSVEGLSTPVSLWKYLAWGGGAVLAVLFDKKSGRVGSVFLFGALGCVRIERASRVLNMYAFLSRCSQLWTVAWLAASCPCPVFPEVLTMTWNCELKQSLSPLSLFLSGFYHNNWNETRIKVPSRHCQCLDFYSF